jgi:hypothetical protein
LDSTLREEGEEQVAQRLSRIHILANISGVVPSLLGIGKSEWNPELFLGSNQALARAPEHYILLHTVQCSRVRHSGESDGGGGAWKWNCP